MSTVLQGDEDGWAYVHPAESRRYFMNNAVNGMGDVTLYTVLGYAVVFFGLSLLMLVVRALGKYFESRKK